MAYPTNPNEPFRPNPADDEFSRTTLRDDPLQPDPELADGAVSGSRIAMYAVGIALVLGAIFYGVNNSNMHQSGATPASDSAQSQPATPPGMRDVTPRTTDSLNTNPGTTTGAAPTRTTPPADTGMNRPAQSPAGTTPPASK